MVKARAGWAGAGALRALRDGGTGYVAVPLRDGAYLEMPGGWLLVAPPRSPLGPLTLLVDALPDRAFAEGDAARIESGVLAVGSVGIDLAGVRGIADPTPPARAADIEPALRAALSERPCAPPDLRDGTAALSAGDHEAAVDLLAGRGPGLTPAGDDVLAGYAAWRHAEGGEQLLGDLAEGRSAPLGLAYLRCAERGELPQVAARVLHAVRAGDPGAAARHARALDGWGATSGTALLWGIAAGAGAVASGGRSTPHDEHPAAVPSPPLLAAHTMSPR